MLYPIKKELMKSDYSLFILIILSLSFLVKKARYLKLALNSFNGFKSIERINLYLNAFIEECLIKRNRISLKLGKCNEWSLLSAAQCCGKVYPSLVAESASTCPSNLVPTSWIPREVN